MRRYRRPLFWTALVLALLFLAGCTPDETIRQSERLDYRQNIREIVIETYNGNVTWRTLPTNRDPYIVIEREVTGFTRPAMESYLRGITVSERTNNNVLTLKVEETSRPTGVTSSRVHFTVYAAPQHIHEFYAATSNAAITVEEFIGVLHAETSNGRIEIGEGAGIVDLRTSNAPILLGDLTLEGDSRVRSSNGRISGNVSISRGRNFTFQTSNANVDLFFPARVRGVFDMQTTNGRVDIDLESQTGSSRNNLVVGRGDPFIAIRTSNGNITVQPQRTTTTSTRTTR